MVDEKATTLSRALMTVAYVDKKTNRSADWPPDVMALFYEMEP
jgi:acyl-CoA thioesterase FadM